MILCVQTYVGESTGHCASSLAGDVGLKDSLVPTGVWNRGEEEEGGDLLCALCSAQEKEGIRPALLRR